ncbi:bifunctional metallophosphatase/5'-nucleotidase [Modestobacter sp. I12A-02628]|uniref:Bifunctional metallophosphatase/5'-nucleotidase n=1 Tax=Goekera deserti TaxID=2497753 RepID=A0A7K3WFA1_9ACTN|nr:bifunctional metallophosphatase/5'-nucleotidase [Goekera deserti]MPQ97215.1 bifunctional metallophosphatase/5'-nucleotidase [Goekera deserti]NDI46467.1 bifunctional metallophosphatase/5'-nucleotidase [Goekera deserti]NEL54599.1 bifunctional metallophosphatase/5'-nucleotidase [Goekera deserti]
MRRRPLAALATTACLSVAIAAAATPASAAPKPAGPKPVDVQLLAFNDFHGALQPPTGSGGAVNGVPAGGLASFATHLRQQEAENKNTLTISNGDLIGGSPFLSALFRDEPTVDAMDLLGLDVATVGNHEFDEGVDELSRIIDGGSCHPVDGCLDGDGYDGSDADWLAANVVDRTTGEPIRSPYEVYKFQGVQVGVIGLTLESTPSIVSAAGIADVRFLDEVETINRYVAELRADGVESIVVSLHEGGAAGADPNGCSAPTGPAFDITRAIDDAVDVVLTGHFHNGFVCEGANEVDGKLVTQALSNGRLITDLDLSIDRKTGDVTSAAAENVVVTRDVPLDAQAQALVERYEAISEPIANEAVGRVTGPIVRAQEPLFGSLVGESPLGNLIADSQLAATDDEAGAVAAFMNPGGVRADITFPSSAAGEGDGVVTFGEAFTVQPFNNLLTTLTLTGTQLYAVLDQQFAVGRVLAPSDSVRYSVAGGAVVPGSLTIAGAPVTADGTYRITVNNFLAGGGDGFTALTAGTDVVNQPGFDVDALIAYLAGDPVAPPATDRITVTG